MSTESFTSTPPAAPAAPPSTAPGAPAHATPLAHHFRDLHQQHEVGTLGMWMFLATEVLFFGAVLSAFHIYRFKYGEAFIHASMMLSTPLAAANTAVLLCSSLTMALAVRAARIGQSRRVQQAFIVATMILGLAFLVIKGCEYGLDYHENLVPHYDFHPEKWPANLDARHGELFFGFYFTLTGLHAVHMVVGLGVMAVLLYKAGQGRYTPQHFTPVEAAGLYWHFVDVVWVFLFPMLYLIR